MSYAPTGAVFGLKLPAILGAAATPATYTMSGTQCVNAVTGNPVSATRCAAVKGSAVSGGPPWLLIGGALALAGGGYWFWKKRKS